jgi:hypothetical protein
MSELSHQLRGNDDPRPRVSARFEDQDRTLRALHQLERAAGAPLRGDEDRWHRDLVDALAVLEEAMAEEQANADRPQSLLSNIAHTQPRLRSRARGARVQYQQVRDTVAELQHDLAKAGGLDVDLDDLRRRVARLASALRYQRARESDLIYEAYYDTFEADIESDIGHTR